MRFALAFGCLVGILLTGCSTLPTAGPLASDVVKQEVQHQRRRFDLVNIDTRVVDTLLAQPQPSFHERFKKYGKPPQPHIGVGDTLSVTIWEAAAGGLFSGSPFDHVTAGARSATIPAQMVGDDGAISVPFAGRVPVAGRTPLEVQHEVQRRLAGKAIEPQAVVRVVKSVNYAATVSGEVVKGARIPLSLNGDRLLDLIAAAGGASAPIYETYVKLSRRGVTATIPMEKLVSDPAENIYAWPGDVLTLIRVPQRFVVLGATGKNAELPFGAEKLTLIQAIAKGGGLQDQRSDPAGVFLFRYEPADVVRSLRVPPVGTGPKGSTPVVFRLDLGNADAYFLAQRFPVKDNDIIFVANARLNELQKFFTLLNTLTGPVISGVVVKNAVP